MKERTGWPPGLLQDDDKRLSKWLASRACYICWRCKARAFKECK